MTQYALPIDPIPGADQNAAIAELDRIAAGVDRNDYFFAGGLEWHVYVWLDGKTPIYAGVGAPNKPRRYLEHWTEAGSERMEKAWYLAQHKTTIWPAFAASNVNSAVAHSLERLLIKAYRLRKDKDGGTLFNMVAAGRAIGRRAATTLLL